MVSDQKTHQVSWHEVTEELLSLYDQKRYEQALGLAQKALQVARDAFGEDHPKYAVSLNNLAGVHFCLGDLDAAEPLYRQALSLFNRHLGRQHPATAKYVNNLVLLYQAQGKPEAAETVRKDYFERN